MRKRKANAKDIVARSITLTDSKGRTRICMGVSDKPANSWICLFGPHNRSIQISADEEGGLHIDLRDGTDKIVAGIAITSDDRPGIFVYDHRSGSRTEVGSDGADQPHHITIHHKGRPHWTTRKRPVKKSQRD